MLLGTTYLSAVEVVVAEPNAMSAFSSERPHPYAVDAAKAAIKRANIDPLEVGPIIHIADFPLPEICIAPAVDLADAAELPTSTSTTTTVAGGPQDVLDALTTAACYLDRQGTTTPTCALITAGDILPTKRRPSPDLLRHNAGAAVVLSKQSEGLQLTATATARDPELAQLLDTHDEVGIRRHTAALIDQVVSEALADAGVSRRDVHAVVTPYAPDSPEHEALVTQVCSGAVAFPPSYDNPDLFLDYASAVHLILRLAVYTHHAAARPTGSPTLVVADSGQGTVTAAVLRAT